MAKLCLGGSFNPIHYGHLICARAAAEAMGADGVVLIPTAVPPHKREDMEIASPLHRLEMCRRAVQHNAFFDVDDREIRRGGPSFTILTVRELHSQGWPLVPWLIGADMLNTLPNWHEAQSLLTEAQFVVMARPGWTLDWNSLPPAYAKLKEGVVLVPQIDISATDIRQRVKNNRPIDFLTPPEVVKYVLEHNLYR
ncbi:MAG: nicotinate-nucleotide adenylyltransferase [Planctomycetota bacterium]|nr:nicotinate-nucleotide adenylyltransferase [Planctomycetota bacterium]